ncbi:fimbria/pilus outer membrane usher protein [Klebsiella pneumoniae]
MSRPGQTSLNINGTFRTNYTTIGASFGQSDTYQQEMINLNGSLVAHSQGILFGSSQIRVKPAMIRAHSRVKKHMGMSKKADK